MALAASERTALHDDLAEQLGRTTADRLMAGLPDVDWSQLPTREYFDQRFELVDKQFKLVHDEFRLVHNEFKLVRDEFKHVHSKIDHVHHEFTERIDHLDDRIDHLDQRFDDAHLIVEGKVYNVIRSHFFGLLGVLFAFAAATVAVVGMTLALAD